MNSSDTMSKLRPAIVSVSLGRASLHDFEGKVFQAAKFGYAGIEIFYEDIEVLAAAMSGSDQSPSPAQLISAAQHMRKLIDSHNLCVLCLQPFSFYEGLLDRKEHQRRIDKLMVWFQLVQALGTDTIQIPANFLPAEQLTDDVNIIVADLVKIADLGLQETPPVRFAYENLCWSTYIDTWEKAWDVVKRVDRPNFGICLDTFNIAGRVWADPAAPSGKVVEADSALEKSLQALVRDIDVNKVFYIQVVDAERMAAPLIKGHPFHVDGQPPRMSWSRNARTFLYEDQLGAYLPVEEIAKVLIHKLGYDGFVSMELFSRSLAQKGDDVPAEHARRGMESWKIFEQRLRINSYA